ncbi:MAG: nucleoside-diphosphate kinase [Nanoarchaeota archaeon]|mgnify:CR=1 FL=1|nr:nucleoside-diphosphate kinase [Nanoarchaeota archaeon]|tara:strand:+ start:1745 stop:2236 length:492 start_codon:yes stop_codon:yes gene_type:complete
MIEQTLVLIKPDGVARGLIGEVISRFERQGLKIIGMKMQWVDKEFAGKHYAEDIVKRLGEKLRNFLLDFIVEGPVVAIVLEGVHVIENVRKIVGDTEPKGAQPGTIRGDYCHVSYDYADKEEKAIRNLIHASGNKEDAKNEIELWFTKEELHDYPHSQDKFTR